MKAAGHLRPESDTRVTIVLGGGWKLGCAFHAGVLLALKDVWGLDARRADALIGTSSGAVVAGLLGAGLGPEDLFLRETAEELSLEGRSIMARCERGSDEADEADGAGGNDASPSPRTQPKGHRTLGLSARGVLTAMLPRGTQSMAHLEQYFDHLAGPKWPADIDLQFCAVDLGTGQRVALNRTSNATVGQAVAASCSVPGVSKPVLINDREYVDGAIYSVNNADLAGASSATATSPTPADETGPEPRHTVIVSAPLSVHRLHARFGPMWVLRNAMHLQTAAELRRLDEVDQVVLIEPTAADVAAMGPNLNANQRRTRVAHSAYSTALGIFSTNPAPSMTDLVPAVYSAGDLR